MKYISLDLETSSLQPSPDHILQVSMVVEDTTKPDVNVEDLPHFTCFVDQRDFRGDAYALGMNGWILDIISGRKKNNTPYPILSGDLYHPNHWVDYALAFLVEHFDEEKITVAGKNVGIFDIPFLPGSLRRRFRHRVLDPGTLYMNWEEDQCVPDFLTCKTRGGLAGEVAHDARDDAMDVIMLLREFYK